MRTGDWGRAGGMRAGDLRHEVYLQAPSKSFDSEGAEVITWTTIATVWAAVVPLTGREYYEAKALNAELTHKVTIRYRRNVQTTWRVLYGSRALGIVSVADVEERHEQLELLCKEVV